ncbi:hypothetical protein ACLOJK_007022 [Asimina triloba]
MVGSAPSAFEGIKGATSLLRNAREGHWASSAPMENQRDHSLSGRWPKWAFFERVLVLAGSEWENSFIRGPRKGVSAWDTTQGRRSVATRSSGFRVGAIVTEGGEGKARSSFAALLSFPQTALDDDTPKRLYKSGRKEGDDGTFLSLMGTGYLHRGHGFHLSKGGIRSPTRRGRLDLSLSRG